MSQELDWKKSAQMMDAAWDRFCVKVSHTFHKPEFDFLKRLLKGVMIQKDVIISKCAKVCRKEGTSIGTFSNIATKHLNKPTFEQRAQQALLQMMAPTVQKDTLIIADESDLAKPYAHYFETEEERGSSRAMEYVDRIRDGSTGEITNGYTLFLATACELGKHEPRPLFLRAWSTKADDYLGETNEVLNGFRRLADALGDRGIYVYDRGGDRRAYFDFFIERGLRFVIRLIGERNLIIHGGKSIKAVTLARSLETPIKIAVDYEKKGKQYQKTLLLGHIHVHLPGLEKELELVVVKGLGKKPLMLLTADLGDGLQDYLIRILHIYMTRWRIEESFRYIKERYHLENLRVLAYESIKSFVAIFAFIFTFVSHGLKEEGPGIIKLIVLSAQHSGPLPSFYYYIIADGLSELFGCQRFWPRPHKPPKENPDQTKFPFALTSSPSP